MRTPEAAANADIRHSHAAFSIDVLRVLRACHGTGSASGHDADGSLPARNLWRVRSDRRDSVRLRRQRCCGTRVGMATVEARKPHGAALLLPGERHSMPDL